MIQWTLQGGKLLSSTPPNVFNLRAPYNCNMEVNKVQRMTNTSDEPLSATSLKCSTHKIFH